MSYGRVVHVRCPECGWDAHGDLIAVDYDQDPPPIPMRVPPALFVDEFTVDECDGCQEPLDPAVLLANARDPRKKEGS